MGKKLECNGLWESSRMMLPEHKKRINGHNSTLNRRQRVELDEQEIEQVTRALADSFSLRQPIRVFLFDESEQLEVKGIVEQIDQH